MKISKKDLEYLIGVLDRSIQDQQQVTGFGTYSVSRHEIVSVLPPLEPFRTLSVCVAERDVYMVEDILEEIRQFNDGLTDSIELQGSVVSGADKKVFVYYTHEDADSDVVPQEHSLRFSEQHSFPFEIVLSAQARSLLPNRPLVICYADDSLRGREKHFDEHSVIDLEGLEKTRPGEFSAQMQMMLMFATSSTKKFHTNELDIIDSRSYSCMVDSLIAAGLPEEAIVTNKALWDFIQRAEKDLTVSKNQAFHVTSADGERILLKFNEDKARAYVEAAANFYLSGHFDFIVPGRFPEPIEAGGLYMTMQKDVSGELHVPRNIFYWLSCFARFHRDAAAILEQNSVELEEVYFRPVDEEAERYLRGRNNHDFVFDRTRLDETIDYLQNSPLKTAVHRDAKNGNRIGPYLIDLELVARGDPGLDLSFLLMQYNVPKEDWDFHLEYYLRERGSENFNEDLKQLRQGVEIASYWTLANEIISTSKRPVRNPETDGENRQIVRYAE